MLPESVKKKLDLVVTRMIAVAVRSAPGCLVYGPGGHGKSHAVRIVIEQFPHARFIRHGTSATARGLFNALRDDPNAVHVVEDMEDIFRGKTLNLMREALWGERDKHGQMVRKLHWETQKGIESAEFSGGMIVCANADLKQNDPVLAAVASRIQPVHYSLSDGEMHAMIRHLAQSSYTSTLGTMTPRERGTVAEYLINESLSGKSLDLRNFAHACDAYLLDRAGHSLAPWQAVVRSMLRERVTDQYDSREKKVAAKAWLAWQLRGLSRAARNRRWKQETGETEMSYTRSLKRARTMGFQT